MSIALVDVMLMLVLLAITHLHLINVISSLLMCTLWMVTVLCYVRIKDAVDCTHNNKSIDTGKKCIYLLFIIRY